MQFIELPPLFSLSGEMFDKHIHDNTSVLVLIFHASTDLYCSVVGFLGEGKRSFTIGMLSIVNYVS